MSKLDEAKETILKMISTAMPEDVQGLTQGYLNLCAAEQVDWETGSYRKSAELAEKGLDKLSDKS